jgi:hypothetical protein
VTKQDTESDCTSSLLGHSHKEDQANDAGGEKNNTNQQVAQQPPLISSGVNADHQETEIPPLDFDDILSTLPKYDGMDLETIDFEDIPEFNDADMEKHACTYVLKSKPKKCTLEVANAKGQTDCTGDFILEDSGKIKVYNVQVEDTDDPTIQQALRSPHKHRWMDALQEEIQSMVDNQVFELVDRPKNANVVKCKWILKIKRKPDGSVDKFKARLVAKGFSQERGVDYFDLWSPTGHHATLKCLFVYALQNSLQVRHIDIKCAFLNGDLEEVVYMEQPPIFCDGTENIWRLKKSIYGLKQSSRQWHKKLKQVLQKLGFKRASYDPALFVDTATHSIMIFMWVDDLFIAASKVDTDRVIDGILHEFQGRDLGEASWLLGMEVNHDHKEGIVKMTQRRMIRNMLEGTCLKEHA